MKQVLKDRLTWRRGDYLSASNKPSATRQKVTVIQEWRGIYGALSLLPSTSEDGRSNRSLGNVRYLGSQE